MSLMERLANVEEQALETMENVLATLRRAPERDDVVQRLIDDIEDQRATLLASRLSHPRPGGEWREDLRTPLPETALREHAGPPPRHGTRATDNRGDCPGLRIQ